jgi:predicted metalloprotease with PDZ domain
MIKRLSVLLLLLVSATSYSQTIQDDKYRYSVDLNNVSDDKLTVELITPKISTSTAKFMMPAMVPGTYSVYNFGRFISDLKAFDNSGNELSVNKVDINTWEVSDAENLHKVTYKVRQTFGDKEDPKVFEPVGTDISEGEVFVFNNSGFFGYFEGMINNDFELQFRKPEKFFGATSMTSVVRNDNEEIFSVPDYHDVIDNPIMFTIPDTATIKFDEMNVLISVYSPGKGLTAKDFQGPNKELLEAIRKHLGGTLPADRYTFLYYFADMSTEGSGGFGALEHNYSSFYYMPDVPAQAKPFMIKQMQSTNAHEFYHVVTPLNLHAEEIGNFDYNNPVMSKHLWLYEGTTEYFADYIQLKEGLISMDEYKEKIVEKLNGAMNYNDSLAFTEMSKNALDEHKHEYLNVYQKGALIGLCMDILIRSESGGQQGWQDVINQLVKKYGKDRSFKDEELFGEIEALTSPKVRNFLDTYVAGSNRIPYDEIFSKIGLVVKSDPYQVADVRGIQMGFNTSTFRIKVDKIKNPENELIKSLGIKEGDELVSFNGKEINYMNARDMFGSPKNQMKPGDKLELVVARMNGDKEEKVTLKSTIGKTNTEYDFSLSESKNLTTGQQTILNAWLGKN